MKQESYDGTLLMWLSIAMAIISTAALIINIKSLLKVIG